MQSGEFLPNCNCNTNYCNITATFSGIGNIILDINSIVLAAIEKYALDIKQCPYQTIYLHFHYTIQNLRKYQLKDILCFYEFTGDPYFDLALKILNEDNSFTLYNEIQDSMENKRIALALCSQKRKDLCDFFTAAGLYVGAVDVLAFEVPFVFTVVTNPNPVVNSTVKYKYNEIERNEPVTCMEAVQLGEKDREFFNFGDDVEYSNNSPHVDEALVVSLLQQSNQVYFDGRHTRRVKHVERWAAEQQESVDKPWSGKDLDLIMPPVPEGVSMKHLINIRRSAMSLYDGKMNYSRVVRETAEKPKKLSGKMQKIIKENEERLRKEKEKTANTWLKNFFAAYNKLPNLKSKKTMLEKMKLDDEYINRKLLLLKIELYSDIWNLEKRCEEVDEKVLVPLYLACLRYFECYVTKEKYAEDELAFVVAKISESGFGATAKELLEKNEITMASPHLEQCSSAPNDIDLYFQLKYAGDHLKRTLGTREDKRVPFDPDEWQVKLLDAVDAGKSAIVSAPTSSGKTFICFYAIEKILRNSDTDMVIFCLPTKALVNQVSADIYARFNMKNVGVSLQGTLMVDRCCEPFNCQVLITVPSMLESYLNSRDCSNVKYIIIDEVHKINDASLGLRIERIIHLARCPLLLLSATLGNLEGFYNWFQAIEMSKQRDCELVCHSERYCELKPYVYTEKNFEDEPGLDAEESCRDTMVRPALVPLNGMFPYSFSHLKKFGFGNDIHFLPEELLNIYLYIYMILKDDQKKLIKSLAPKKFFKSNIICKADIREYQKHLLSTFKTWVNNGTLEEAQVQEVHNLLTTEAHDAFNFDTSEKYIAENILNVLNALKDSNMLPVIVFNTDRDFVTRLARIVYEKLEDMDIARKKDRMMEKMKKEAKRTRDQEKGKDAWIEESIAAEQLVEPEQRDIKYTFLDPITKLTDYEVKEEFAGVKEVPKDILDMAYRGIGIHHSATNRKYRSSIEILFRKKHVRVLFATETLALGINMPCRSVVFAGDSLQLDPMNYKQMSGRAGRRGFDTLGNVVFFGMSKCRVQSLMVSMLPEIQGAYTYSNTSLVSFNIDESIIRHPLVSAAADRLKDDLAGLGLTHKTVAATLDVLDHEKSRAGLVDLQRSLNLQIYPSSYLWDLYVSNRESDPGVFVFAVLLKRDAINWQPNEFINLVAHLFEVRPVLDGFEHALPPLAAEVQACIGEINERYIEYSSGLLPPALRVLQRQTQVPLLYLKSFAYTYQGKKNSFIYDFYQHGSSFKIRKNNLIQEGELWQSLNTVDYFLKSLIRLLETYFEPLDERLKKLRPIYAEFSKKYQQIFA